MLFIEFDSGILHHALAPCDLLGGNDGRIVYPQNRFDAIDVRVGKGRQVANEMRQVEQDVHDEFIILLIMLTLLDIGLPGLQKLFVGKGESRGIVRSKAAGFRRC